MRYASIRSMDISNGDGVRISLFVQGCSFKCQGCFNASTWDFNQGKLFTSQELQILLDLCSSDYIRGLSILGGEPLHPNNIETVIDIAQRFKKRFPDKDLWIWTGYKYEVITSSDIQKDILNYCDVLVDGQFEEDKKDLLYQWAGSTNQRVIDVQQSLKNQRICLWKTK